MSGHSIIKCTCGEVLSQCRCPAPDKVVVFSTAPCTHKTLTCYKCGNVIGRDEVASRDAGGFYHSLPEQCYWVAPANPYIFNPPPASEMVEAEPEPTHLPYSLRRKVIGEPRLRVTGRRPLPGEPDDRVRTYYRNCARQRCAEEIQCYRVITGTRMEAGNVGQSPHQVRDYVYYWSDTAIVVETATEYNTRPVQSGLCSFKCLSLWSAKVARDTES